MKTSLDVIQSDPAKKDIYFNVLNHIFDNPYPDQNIDGNTVRAQ